ncbi:MAG: phosphoribosylanthranilate isomerase, partial [Planctomycetota bacterium]
MQVKICGITTLDDARAAALAGADFIGLIRAPGPRQVSVTAAREIITALPPSARPVLVFRNAQVADVLAEAAMAGAVWIQLHGHEPLAYLEALQRQRPGLRLIKAWEVASPRAAEELRQYLASAVR